MVVMGLPLTDAADVMQLRTGCPSTSTVHAPQAAMPQPYFVPVRPT